MNKLGLLIFLYLMSGTFCKSDLFQNLETMPKTTETAPNITTTTSSTIINKIKLTSHPNMKITTAPTNTATAPTTVATNTATAPTTVATNQRLPPVMKDPKNPILCRCVPIETECKGHVVHGATGKKFDVRIVNNDNSTRPCLPGYKNCCTQALPLKCGMKKILSLEMGPSNQALYGSYPWHAQILSLDNKFLGAGVIINEYYILTVAHKVVDLKNMYKIKLGKWNNKNNNEPSIEVRPVITKVHEKYDSDTFENDIAIIKVNQKIMFNDYHNINAACLPESVPLDSTSCWTAGWGKSSFTADKDEDILKEVELPIVEHDKCESMLQKTRLAASFKLNGNSFICAGGIKGKDACTGDGGGALVCEQKPGQFAVVGLTSWGIGCGEQNVPGVYVNVNNYLQWIEMAMIPKMLDPRSVPL